MIRPAEEWYQYTIGLSICWRTEREMLTGDSVLISFITDTFLQIDVSNGGIYRNTSIKMRGIILSTDLETISDGFSEN